MSQRFMRKNDLKSPLGEFPRHWFFRSKKPVIIPQTQQVISDRFSISSNWAQWPKHFRIAALNTCTLTNYPNWFVADIKKRYPLSVANGPFALLTMAPPMQACCMFNVIWSRFRLGLQRLHSSFKRFYQICRLRFPQISFTQLIYRSIFLFVWRKFATSSGFW